MNDLQRAYAAAILDARAARGEYAAAQKAELEAAAAIPVEEREATHLALAEDPDHALRHWQQRDADAAARDERLRASARRRVYDELGVLSPEDSARIAAVLGRPPEPPRALREALASAKAVQRPEAPAVTAAREEGRWQEREAVLVMLRVWAEDEHASAAGYPTDSVKAIRRRERRDVLRDAGATIERGEHHTKEGT